MALDFGNAITGAASGAMFGSTFGAAGTAVGAGIGGLTGLFGSNKKKRKKLSTFDPQQQNLYDQQMQGLSGTGPFADLYKFNSEAANKNFDQNVAQPAYRGFQENVIPSITGQFRQNNLQNSTWAGEGLSRAGRDVQESLNGLRSNMQFQGQQAANERRSNTASNLLNMTTFDYENQEASPIDQILGSLAQPAGKWLADNYLTKGVK